MNIEALEYYKKISEVKSISKVSQQSHISQSALSLMMQKLEEKVGYELFVRSNKGIELTDMGKVVYEYANVILKTYQKMKDELSCLANKQSNIIINSTWAIANYSLPCLLIEIKNQCPQFHYELRSNRSEDIIANVENGLVDFGIIYGEPNSKRLNAIHFSDEEIVLVANKEFKIPEQITLNELFSYHLITFKHGCYNVNINDLVTKYLGSEKDARNKFISFLDLDSISAVKSSVAEGFGISFLPFSSVKKEVQDNKFKIIKLKDFSLSLSVTIISLPRAELKLDVARIIDILLKFGPKHLC